jgi:signal-transduction protein with cAMP-binding, CBS, and nucleotidyltransferase domain
VGRHRNTKWQKRLARWLIAKAPERARLVKLFGHHRKFSGTIPRIEKYQP